MMHGKVGQQRGSTAERAALRIAQDAGSLDWPIWVYGARGATRHEDENGIDIVFATQYGPMFIQVKAGTCPVEKKRRYTRKRIGVVERCLKLIKRPRSLRTAIIYQLDRLRLNYV